MVLLALTLFGCDGGGDGSDAVLSVAAEADGLPDCGTAAPWFAAGAIDLSTGSPTAEQALRPYLEQWQTMFGGDVVMVGDDGAALQLDGAEVVVAYTVRTDDGGFAVADSTGCDGFGPNVLPGPP